MLKYFLYGGGGTLGAREGERVVTADREERQTDLV